jgi:hypothetical protein
MYLLKSIEIIDGRVEMDMKGLCHFGMGKAGRAIAHRV